MSSKHWESEQNIYLEGFTAACDASVVFSFCETPHLMKLSFLPLCRNGDFGLKWLMGNYLKGIVITADWELSP